MSYAGDVVRARRLMPLVKEGFAGTGGPPHPQPAAERPKSPWAKP